MSNCGTCGSSQICTCYFTSECVIEEDWYISLDAVTGTYVSTPDSTDNSVTGSLLILSKAAAVDWTPASSQNVLAKWVEDGNQRSYRLQINTSGGITFSWSPNGTTVNTAVSTVPVLVTDGQPIHLGAMLDSSTGNVSFFTSNQEYLSSFAQLGATVSGGGATSIFNSNSPLEIGSQDNGTVSKFVGRIYSSRVYSADSLYIIRARFHPDDAVGKTDGTQTPITVTSSETGEMWTLQGAAEWGFDPVTHCAIATGSGRSYAPVNFRPDNVPLPRPYGAVYRNVTQTIAASTINEPIVWTVSETPFAGGMVDFALSNNRLFIPEDGYYLLWGSLRTTTPGTGGDHLIIRRGGVETLVTHTGAIDDCAKSVMTLARLLKGDYVQLALTTPSGGDTVVETGGSQYSSYGSGNFPPQFWAQWMRGL